MLYYDMYLYLENMIELSQWRASIGLWNCCSSGMKPTNKLCQCTKKQSTTDVGKGLQQLFSPHFLIVIGYLVLNSIFAIGKGLYTIV